MIEAEPVAANLGQQAIVGGSPHAGDIGEIAGGVARRTLLRLSNDRHTDETGKTQSYAHIPSPLTHWRQDQRRAQTRPLIAIDPGALVAPLPPVDGVSHGVSER